MKKRLGMTAAMLCLAMGVAGVGPARAEVGVTDDKILFGSFQDMSGPGAYLGKQCALILGAWKKWVNEELGGIHGRKVDFVIEDNKYDPVLTKTALTKLVDQHKVFALTAVYGSAPCTAILEDIDKAKIPVFATAATVESMFDPPRRYLFHYACSDQDNAIMMVDYILNDMKVKDPKIGIVYQDDEWGKDALAGIEKACKKYGLKYDEAAYKRGEKSLNPQAMKMKAAGVTHCFYAGYAPVYASLLQEAAKVGWKPLFFGDYVTVDPKTFMAGDLANGHYHFFNLGLRSEGVEGWKKLEKILTAGGAEEALDWPLAPLMWNPLLMWTKGLQDCGRDVTREKMVDILEGMKNFDTEGLGKIQFGPNLRKGGHVYRVLKCDAEKKIFVPVTDWREPSLVWGKR
jgi:branched-chain amino acid transport system substrate-binding protein